MNHKHQKLVRMNFGIGIAFLSRNAILPEIKSRRLVEVEISEVEIRRCLYLVTNPDRVPSPTIQAAIQVIEAFRAYLNRPIVVEGE